jgi:hypothetical protein
VFALDVFEPDVFALGVFASGGETFNRSAAGLGIVCLLPWLSPAVNDP